MNIIKHRLPALLAALLLAAWTAPLCAAPRQFSPLADSLRKARKGPSFAERQAYRRFLNKNGKGWKVRFSPVTALPEALTGGRTARYPGTPEQAAAAFFADNADLLKVDPLSLRLVNKKEFMGVTHLQYQQYKDGLPVEFAYARVHVDADGSVSGYQGKFEPDLPAYPAPAVTADAAVAAADADLGARLAVSKTELVLYPDPATGTRRLAWKVRGRGKGLWVYYVDAADGKVLFRYDDLRRACAWATHGTSSGVVYAISPIPTNPASDSMYEFQWDPPVNAPLQDQYVWVAGYSSSTVTDASGDYCTNTSGKAFSSLKGPFFAVTNFRGESAHWDNAGGTWETASTPLQSPHPYANSQDYSYPVTLTDTWSGRGLAFAKAEPHFTSFQAGEMDIYGSLNDGDQMYVVSGGLPGAPTVGAYTGIRRNAFYGAAVENPSFTVRLKTDASGTYNGFVMDQTRVLLLPAGYNSTNNATGSVLWGPGQTNVTLDTSLGNSDAISEANAFYHLNKVHRYFDAINIDPLSSKLPADLSRRVAVMAHAHGDADMIGTEGGMLNAFYDLENDNIMLGDGPYWNGSYRSFALDGTIVRHEYIHLVVNRIYPIVNFGEFGAVSEALADYFSMASFWDESCTGCSTINTLGNFIGSGEGSARSISGTRQLSTADYPACAQSPYTCWAGEVHDDSMFLSQALYSLRPGGTRDIGTFSSGAFAGRRRSDVLTYAALFYFPDNFANFRDAMTAACASFNQTWAGSCDAAVQGGIANAFADHGIGAAAGGDAYETSGTSPLCDNNNGPECATELANASSVSATVYPLGDVDYYSLPLSAGLFTAALSLPAAAQDGYYQNYAMLLFDADRNIALNADGTEAIAMPHVDYPIEDVVCPDSGECLTQSPSVTLSYNVPAAGRYYLVVSAGLNQYYGNSETSSASSYTLGLSRSPAGSAAARISAAVVDNDQISFDVPYTKFPMVVSPSSSTLTGAEVVYEYARLRDHNFDPLDLTRTNLTGSYLKDVAGDTVYSADVFGNPVFSRKVQLQPGFAARYPAAGTVYLEIFGRNHLGNLVSLGVSNAVHLSASAAEATAYNNIITGGSGSAIIKYAVTSAGNLSVKVYTQAGALVRTVYSGPVPAGKGTLEWDGTNSTGGKAASGIYFVKIKGPGLDKIVKIGVVR